MPSDPMPVQTDPDFRPSVGAGSFRVSPDAGRYRRIVFNPLPAPIPLTVWLWVAGNAVGWAQAILPVPWPEVVAGLVLGVWLLLCLLILPWAIRFHCLDCGATGRATRWKQHLCPKVVARIFAAREARWRPPGAIVQGLFWVWVMAFAVAAVRG